MSVDNTETYKEIAASIRAEFPERTRLMQACIAIESLIRERDDARAHLEALSRAATCACSYDNPDDVCMTHQKMKAEAHAAGYRRGVEDAARVIETFTLPGCSAAILALLEQSGKKKLSDYSLADFEEQK